MQWMFKFFCLVAALMTPVAAGAAETRLKISGGPQGGTFQYFSNGIASRLARDLPDVEAYNMASAGSVENIRRVNSGDADFGIAYSGDTYLARDGRLSRDGNKYDDVFAVAYLYGAPAHLLVRESSGIENISDLAGKRIAVGGAGSGAAAAARRYFGALGLWDKMNIEFIGYSKAARAMGKGLIDAMWVFAGFPNSSVIQAAAGDKVRILPTWRAGEEKGVFAAYPFYSPVTIPAGTYRGVDYDVETFQDSTLWIAGRHLPEEIVYRAVARIFSAEGLDYMVKIKTTARAMSVEEGLTGIVTPLHEGAVRFWREKGMKLTRDQLGR